VCNWTQIMINSWNVLWRHVKCIKSDCNLMIFKLKVIFGFVPLRNRVDWPSINVRYNELLINLLVLFRPVRYVYFCDCPSHAAWKFENKPTFCAAFSHSCSFTIQVTKIVLLWIFLFVITLTLFIKFSNFVNHIFILNKIKLVTVIGTRSGAVGLGTALQIGWPWVRFLIRVISILLT
jgi:hypothetical protein